MTIDLIREQWSYHHWANRRLFEFTAAQGEEVAGREVGEQFSVLTLRGLFTHIWGADRWWLGQWTGRAAARRGASMLYDDPPETLAALRPRWDALESEQRRFLDGLTESDLSRIVEGQGRLGAFRIPLGVLLLHVVNHATHHRSEIATMLTMLGHPPPDTGLVSYHRTRPDRV